MMPNKGEHNTTHTHHCEQQLAWGIVGAKDHKDSHGDTEDRRVGGAEPAMMEGMTKDKGDNGVQDKAKKRWQQARDEEPPPPILQVMACRVGQGMFTNTAIPAVSLHSDMAVFLIYILPATPSRAFIIGGGLSFLLQCHFSDFYYCRNTCEMTINSNNNIMLHCQFGRVVKVTCCGL